MLREEKHSYANPIDIKGKKALDRTQPDIREEKRNYAKPVGAKGEKKKL